MKPVYFFLTLLVIMATSFMVVRCGSDNPVTPPAPPLIPVEDRCVQIGTPMLSGHTYSWSPATGLVSPNTAQTLACPKKTTVYTVTATTQCGKATSQVKVSVKKVVNGQLVEVTD